jgi:eukaryotic-like serine/threonine-protein kinase
MDFQVGQTFGDYSITGVLDAGGMGRVYKVEHSITQRTEAMKVLSAEVATETEIKRFEREMRVLARLNHPNIAALHNAVHGEQQLILLMEFIEGQTLESILAGGRLPIETGIGYVQQILSALAYAHQQGVVHRDVTPANVLVSAAGEVKLTDFGLSKSFGDPLLTNCGDILGALPYMAPEQLKGVTQPDQRTDLYSVAAILYEHLTGKKPFGTNRQLAPVLTDSEADPPPPSQLNPSLPSRWDPILRRALSRNPEHRYQSAQEFLDAIAQNNAAPAPELPLPHLSKAALGAAILAGVVVAVAASPAIKSLRPVAPISVPAQRLHIVPPGFATSTAVARPTPRAPEPVTARMKVPRPKPVVHATAKAIVIEPPPSLSIANTPPDGQPDVLLPIPAQAAIAPPPVEAAPPPKKTFWGKMNVFKKKKNPDSADTNK